MRAKSPLLLAAVGAALSIVQLAPAPGMAQGFSTGYQFLKAVRDRDGAVVNDTLRQPGSVVVNARDLGTGETALHIVTERRDLTWVRFLTARGANPNIEDKRGTTPLQLAVILGFTEGAEALISAGARVDVTNSSGETPLISAVHRRDVALVRMLLEKGANPDRTDNSGRSARDYVGLMTSNSQLLEVFDEAAKTRNAKSGNYGPVLR